MTTIDHGPLVDPAEVPDWLRPLVRRTGQVDVERLGWAHPDPHGDDKPAAVLILFGDGEADSPRGPDVLLLRRADNLNSHPGQVAFPGGALDSTDAGPVEAALREAVEEVGVLPSGIKPVATLPELHLSFSGFRVTPVIAYWHEPSPVQPVDAAETAAVARVPISVLTEPANRIKVRLAGDRITPAFLVPGMLVWGFTGGLLSGLLDLGGFSRPWNRGDVREIDEAWRTVREAEPDGPHH